MYNLHKVTNEIEGLVCISLFLPINKSNKPDFLHYFEGTEEGLNSEIEQLRKRYNLDRVEIYLIT